MRVYISGKMTGCPDLNRPAFDAAAKRLRSQGHFVINPHDIAAVFGTAEEVAKSFAEYYRMLDLDANFFNHTPATQILERTRIARSVMDSDLAAVRSCDAIYLLRGWQNSRGAKKELDEAIKCGLDVMLEGAEDKPRRSKSGFATTSAAISHCASTTIMKTKTRRRSSAMVASCWQRSKARRTREGRNERTEYR